MTSSRLPLSIKLLLLGFIPLAALFYFEGNSFFQKKETKQAIQNQVSQIELGGNVASLISRLQQERDASYQFMLTRKNISKVHLQRPRTDSFILILKKNIAALNNWDEYAFKKKLSAVRDAVDAVYDYPSENVLADYTGLINTINQLNPYTHAGNIPEYVRKDLLSQRKLLDVSNQLGIIRSAIFCVLYTNQLYAENLIGIKPNYLQYKNTEKQFLSDASDEGTAAYQMLKEDEQVKRTNAFIDTIFIGHRIDSSYTAASWWKQSSSVLALISNQQDGLFERSDAIMKQAHEDALEATNNPFYILIGLVAAIIILLSVIVILFFKSSSKPRQAETSNPAEVLIRKENVESIFKKEPVVEKLTTTQEILFASINLHNQENTLQNDADIKPVELTPTNGAVEENKNGHAPGKLSEKMREDLIKLVLEKDKVRAEIGELMKWKEDFLNVASHELKTPVASLKAYTQLLQTDAHAKGDANKEGMYAKMDLQVDKLNKLVNDLLDTTRIQNGKLVYHHQNFSFDRLIRNVVEETQMHHNSHQIVIEKNPPVVVFGDRDRIGQVLSIFLNNAIRYCPDAPLIIVRSETVENRVVCSVQDFGCGISKKHQQKIFDEFYRGNENSSAIFPGLGLGLFIAREVITRHKGKIWLKSREDEGSIFYFSIPVLKKNDDESE